MNLRRSCRGVQRPAIAFLLAITAWGSCLALPAESDRWIRVETENFVLFGDAGKNRVVEIGQRLERLREVLTKTTKGMTVHSPLPTHIYVFKNERSFGPYNLDDEDRPTRIAGYFVGTSEANYVAVDASAADSSFEVIYHEYLHYFMNNNLPNLPQWLDEGFAEFYSTFRVRGEKAEIGRHVDRHLVILHVQPMIPLPQLFAITVESDDYHGQRAGTFYAESWALTHYLMVGSEKGQSGINRYVNLLNRGADSVEAFPAAFGFGLTQAEAELRRYVQRDRHAFLVFDLDKRPEKQRGQITPLERQETVYRLGELLSHTAPVRYEAAETHYREALRLDATHAPSYVGLGRLEEIQGLHTEAASFYEKAIAIDPNHAAAYERHGHSVLQEYLERTGGRLELNAATPEAMLEARALFTKSLELDPTSMNAHAGFGKTFYFGGQDVGPGIASLTRAAAALPARTDVLYDLLVLHVQAGNGQAARAVLDDALRHRADDELVAHAERAIVALDLQRSDALLAEGKVDEAMVVLERVADETGDPELEQQIRARLAASRSLSEAESMIELYNLAMADINAGEYDKALTILEQLVPEIDEPGLKAEGEAHIASLRATTRHNRLVGRFNRAVELANAGDLGGAARLLERVLADEPEEDLRQKAEALLTALGEQR